MPDTPWVAIPAEDGEGWNVARIKGGRFLSLNCTGTNIPVELNSEQEAQDMADTGNKLRLREAVMAAQKGGDHAER